MDGCLFAVSSRGKGDKGALWGLFHKGINLSHLQRAHLQIPSHPGTRFQAMNLEGGTQTFSLTQKLRYGYSWRWASHLWGSQAARGADLWRSMWKVKDAQLCPTLHDPMDYIDNGILQAIILEWVAVAFSRRSSQLRDRTQVSHIAGGFFTSWATREEHSVFDFLIWAMTTWVCSICKHISMYTRITYAFCVCT